MKQIGFLKGTCIRTGPSFEYAYIEDLKVGDLVLAVSTYPSSDECVLTSDNASLCKITNIGIFEAETHEIMVYTGVDDYGFCGIVTCGIDTKIMDKYGHWGTADDIARHDESIIRWFDGPLAADEGMYVVQREKQTIYRIETELGTVIADDVLCNVTDE